MRAKLIRTIICVVLCLAISGSAFAGSVNLLNYLSYDPAERNQGNCGNCWVWAGTAVMEIARAVQNAGKDRLSIQFVNSCDTAPSFACAGGLPDDFKKFYQYQGFAIPWSNTNAAFHDGAWDMVTTLSAVSCGSIGLWPNYPISFIAYSQIVTRNVSQSTAIANIKNVLNQNKAVHMDFYWPNADDRKLFLDGWIKQDESFKWNPDFSCGHTWVNDQASGHAVVIVGYNDDDPDPDRHHWIVLNSWGIGPQDNRPNGLFLMKMNINYDCTYPRYSYYDHQALVFYDYDYTFPGSAACAYSISPTSLSFGSSAGSGGVNIATQSGCSWTVNGNPDWVTITSGSSGTGNGVVNYKISANTNTQSRQGEFTIAGKAFMLTQEGSSTVPSTILLNGDFESGLQNWTEYSSGGYYLITNYAPYAFSGSWFAWLGGYDQGTEMIYQDVAIPSDATSASVDFYYQIATDETATTTAYDKMVVGILNPSDNTVLKSLATLSNLDASSDWVRSNQMDISEFVDQTIRLVFDVTTDWSNPSYFIVDDVSLSVTFSSRPNITPYQPSGWSDKIVVSNATGSYTDSNPLNTTDTLYVDWAVLNNGSVATASTFDIHLYVDGVQKTGWQLDPPRNPNNYIPLSDYSIGSLDAGQHEIKIVADSSEAIDESNENDNTYTKTITVQGMSVALPVPTAQMTYANPAIVTPVLSSDPAQAHPIGIGDVATGGSNLSVAVAIDQFTAPVDIYFLLYSPTIDPFNVYQFTFAGLIQPISAGLVPWKSASLAAVNENLFGNIPVSCLPSGTYELGLLVTPAGDHSLTKCYLWVTEFML